MKIYRGPSEKAFDDDTHQLVSQVDMSTQNTAWTKRQTLRVNLTKDGWERRSVGHIVFDEKDVVALHQSLMEGLLSQSAQHEDLKKQVTALRSALSDIHMFAALSSNATANQNLEKIKNRASEALSNAPKF